MIGFLRGEIFSISTDSIVLLVDSVGYEVHIDKALLGKVNKSDKLNLFIHSHIREDCFDLYGFASEEELKLFRLLITVSGVGPKTALGIMDKGVVEIKAAISKAETKFFVGIPRLGQKNAQKIIIELKSKVGSLNDLDLSGSVDYSEVEEALLVMGYSEKEIEKMVKDLPFDLNIEEKIKLALKKK